MDHKSKPYIIVLCLITAAMACSITGVQRKATSAEQTVIAVQTDVRGIAAAGDSIIKTAEALG